MAKFCIGVEYPNYGPRDEIVSVSKHIDKCFTSWRKAKKAFGRLVSTRSHWDEIQPILCKRGKYRCEPLHRRQRSRKKNQKVSARAKRRHDYIPF